MKKIVFLFLSLFVFTFCVKAEVKEVTLEKCVDGDTASFKLNDEVVKFRFLAIDTPESVHPTKKEQAYGKSASTYTCEILTNAKSIKVEYEENNKTDKYGRNLAWIWVDDELLQKRLVEEGYAEVAYIYGNYKYTNALCAIQQDAKKAKLNIWSEKSRKEGYCSTVDTSEVSKEIKLTEDVTSSNSNTNEKEEKKVSNEQIIYIVIITGCVLIMLFTGRKISTKKVKKITKEYDKIVKDIKKK